MNRRVLCADAVRILEHRLTSEGKNDGYALAVQAAEAFVKTLITHVSNENKTVLVVVGGGNNGTDGYLIAQRLIKNGMAVTVAAVCPPKSENCKRAASEYSGRVASHEKCDFSCVGIIVDALFGIGFHGVLEGLTAKIVKNINQSSAFIASVDIPSGLCADNSLTGECVHADLTVTFFAYKPCHILFPAAAQCGKTVVAYLCAKEEDYKDIPLYAEIIEPPVLEVRQRNTHKGTYGTAALVCGSYGMAGAAILSLRAALKSGVGIGKAVVPKSIYPMVTTAVPEAVCIPYRCSSRKVKDALKSADSVLLGCGLSTTGIARRMLLAALRVCRKTLILDADGLNLLSRRIELIEQTGATLILTPHPGEMARLTGKATADIEADRVGNAIQFALKHHVILVLKGAHTVVATPDGKAFINLTGNAGMATGGSGDTLSGILAALTAGGIEAAEAAKAAVYLHGAAGDMAKLRLGERSALPSDLSDELPGVFKTLGENGV